MQIEIIILEKRCKGCGICVEVCQTEVLVLSDTENEEGYRFPVVRDLTDCLNCKMCEMFCPDFAIWVSNVSDEALK